MMQYVVPHSGEGWADLAMTPKYNGGDAYPPEISAGQVDASLEHLEAVGLTVDSTPSALFILQPVAREDGQAEYLVHWCNDGRAPLAASLDLLDALTREQPRTLFRAFVRRPALVRLLSGRGWHLTAQEAEPFMALLSCQREKSNLT